MPFRSKAQHRLCRVKNDPNWDCSEWAHETPSMKRLPEHKRRKKKKQPEHGIDLDSARKAIEQITRPLRGES